MSSLVHRARYIVLAVVAACTAAASLAEGQRLSNQDRDRARGVLAQTRKDLLKYYYDTTFGGWDMESAYARADSAIQTAPTLNHAFAMVAQFVSELNDSHTRFHPPSHANRVDYGIGMQAFGDTVRVTFVDWESDAEAKDVRAGDRLIAWDLIRLDRRSLELVYYVYYSLSPRPGVRLTLQRDGEDTVRIVDIKAKITRGRSVIDLTDIDVQRDIIASWEDDDRRTRHFYRAFGDSVLVWLMPSFRGGDREGIDEMMKHVRGRRGVVLDLRDNGGGAVVTLEYLIGKFFNREVPYARVRLRLGESPRVVKPTETDPYLGMLVVLINSNSGSASEILAATMKAEGRAIVVGDRSAGAVVMSRSYVNEIGFERVYAYVNQISVADVRLPTGERLEGVGVTPDSVVIPTPDDLCKGRDPQLAKALAIAGVSISSEEAAQLFASKKEEERRKKELEKRKKEGTSIGPCF